MLHIRIKRLPKELREKIFKALLKKALLPGEVYPGIYDSKRCGFRIEWPQPGITSAFKLESEHLENLAETWFYASNTWVIGKGGYSTVSFLDKFPSSSLIDSVVIRFSWQDCPYQVESQEVFMQRNMAREKLRPTNVTEAELKVSCKHMHIWWEEDTISIWLKKFYKFSLMDLSHIELDFTEAFDPNAPAEEFLGKIAAEYCLPLFAYGLPPHFTIKAPSTELKDQILQIFRVRNLRVPTREKQCRFCEEELH
ncbi:hypothetical protein MMC19_000396 [Ptychographa xylographoides]|nr:hypothetical protein [Ptychographa xylographoides]